MPRKLLDYFVSAPVNSSGSLDRVIPVSPSNIKLAEFGLNVTQSPNIVDLKATIGWEAVAGRPTVLFKIFRGTQVIFTTIDELDITLIQNKTVTFTAVDFNAPVGFNKYSLTVELTNPEGLINQASVVGPITFSGAAYGNA
ncbi:hypothetical protein ACSVDE_14235 [Pseudalkalibacillus sp. Hm43]|uniref:hypothetical protein n=1 Tax=Pseudalkalibacillus sp. Hm43 TaxID=3450742 RepID=UPI003F424A58